jgi:putative DNA primase/helicase
MESYHSDNKSMIHQDTPRNAHTFCENTLSIPHSMKQQDGWMGTCLKHKPNGKIDKPPYRVRQGMQIQPGSKTNPEHRASFEEAIEALERGDVDAIGRVFTSEDPFTVVDLDNVRDPTTGHIAPWAMEIVEAVPTYWEVSLSGTGLHGIAEATKNTERCRKGHVEVYDGGTGARFMVLTGNHLQHTSNEVQPCQSEIDVLTRKVFPPEAKPKETHRAATEAVVLEDRELLDKARNSRTGERFRALYDRGDFLDNASHSEARMELLRSLAFWTAWDEARMASLYEGSALYAMPGYARKWQRLRDREIRRAIADTPRAYRQPARASNEDGGELAPVIEALQAQAWAMPWEGRSGPTDRHVYTALLAIAARYGSIAKKGIMVSADVRSLALDSGTGLGTVSRALKRLHKERNLLRLSKKSTGKKAAVYLLKYPTAVGGTQNKCVDSCSTYRQLRNRGPSSQKEYDRKGRKRSVGSRYLLDRLGKYAALILEYVAEHGEEDGLTLPELARGLDRKAGNIASSKAFKSLLSAGVLLEEDGRFKAPHDFEWRLQVELEQSGCVEARRLDAKRYARERSAFRSRDKNEPGEAPSQEDMDRVRSERVVLALDAFAHEGSGPQLILFSYLDGETKEFTYVVKAVAYYYGVVVEVGTFGDGWRLWERAVHDAYSLYMGEEC